MRLTWRRADGAVCPRVEKGTDYHYIAGEFTQKVYDKLAAYEDAEEQGRLVILPCRVGDTAYVIWDSSIYPNNLPVVQEDHITQVKFTTKGCAFKTWRGWYHKSDIGKTVFLTREEAEVALKGGHNDASNT